MKFDFFTFGGRFFWEDVINYQNWVIQRNIRTQKYRLLDNHNIRRDSGSFEECKNTLLKYIEACELESPYNDSIILLHNYGRTKFSWNRISESLSGIKANIIAVNYASLHKSLVHHANLLESFLKNLNTPASGKLYFVTHGAGCLVLRKFLAQIENYRIYNIAQVLDINPINSGSDLADLLRNSAFLRKILGPMLFDMTPKKALDTPKLPHDIPHGIIFYPPAYTQLLKKLLSRYESFPLLTPPSESSYAENICNIQRHYFWPLTDSELGKTCFKYLTSGKFESKAATPTEAVNSDK